MILHSFHRGQEKKAKSVWKKLTSTLRHTPLCHTEEAEAKRRPSRSVTIVNFRRGYVFLLAILFIGAIVTAISIAMILMGTSAYKSGRALERSAYAYQLAQSCAERALFKLRGDPGYAGNETVALGNGTCTIMRIAGAGNFYRTVCVTGTFDGVVRNIEIALAQVLFTTKVNTWREVGTITQCT